MYSIIEQHEKISTKRYIFNKETVQFDCKVYVLDQKIANCLSQSGLFKSVSALSKNLVQNQLFASAVELTSEAFVCKY